MIGTSHPYLWNKFVDLFSTFKEGTVGQYFFNGYNNLFSSESHDDGRMEKSVSISGIEGALSRVDSLWAAKTRVRRVGELKPGKGQSHK